MSEWIVSAASSAVWPLRSVHARVSLSPAVKNVIRSSASLQPRDDLLERRRAAVAERGRLLVVELGQLRLELRGRSRPGRSRPRAAASSSAARAPAAARRRSPRASPPRRRARAACRAPRPPRGASGRPTSPASRPRSSRFSTWSRSATSSSSLRFSRSRAGSRAEKPSSDDEQRVDLAQVPEQRRARARHVLTRGSPRA